MIPLAPLVASFSLSFSARDSASVPPPPDDYWDPELPPPILADN